MLQTGPALGGDLDSLSLEELGRAEVTSVSRKSQSLSDVAAAAFVISSDDIRRSGAQNLPDVLRMAPGVEVAQIDNGRHAVSIRGFNGRFSNKLQVLVDGRSLYHPLFAGVIWEIDPVPLEDIERIEIIRGAGAVMWGANAVNGLINIITRHSGQQAGGAVSIAAGTQGQGKLYARTGGGHLEQATWKLSVQGRHIDPSVLDEPAGQSADHLDNALVDFRLDRELGNGSDLTIWANGTHSELGDHWNVVPNFGGGGLRLSSTTPTQVAKSQSLVGRYRWLSDRRIESSLQLAATHSGVELPGFIDESRNTFDIDYQGRFAFDVHDLIWGLNHRTSADRVITFTPAISIGAPEATQRNTGVFAHDDWTLVADTLKLGLGVRADQTTGNGINYAANASLLWTPTRTDSVWLKLAQAPRTSARAERDVAVLTSASVVRTTQPGVGTAAIPVIGYNTGGEGLAAEKARGLELGYRRQITPSLSADVSAYLYRYSDLRTGTQTGLFGCTPYFGAIAPMNAARCAYFRIPAGTPVIFVETKTVNGLDATTHGLEFSGEWLVTPNWRLQLSYAWSQLRADHNSDLARQTNGELFEDELPRHVASLRSQWNLSPSQQLDVWLRGTSGVDQLVSASATPSSQLTPARVHIAGYATLDVRYAHRLSRTLELSLTGRNLIGDGRLETRSDYVPTSATTLARTWLLGLSMAF